MADVRSALDEAAIAVRLQKSKPKKTTTTTTSSDGRVKTQYTTSTLLLSLHTYQKNQISNGRNEDRNSTN
jgi:hypothetical protein